MNWKFWKKQNHRENSGGTKEAKLARPKELPDRVGRFLVTQLKEDPDWVWSLKCAIRPKADEKNVFEVRIFNPATAAKKGVAVANFHSLDAHPDIILFFGSFNKNTDSVQLEKTLKNAA
ncbi:MAG: hypothetical protein V2J65_31965 [Desulfobacteraceae bacterium]|jgi:hypothetical protein|nr:hypothetical protein [Desulfobacteraceae bacterium]